ncbi:MAG TPA: Type 1 glutamine amidotransferase-like domain-containing protein [Gaiellaceae bacterium]
MKLLLTSGGIRNASIRGALDKLLPKPVEECDALGITTASYAHPHAGPPRAWAFVADDSMTSLPWKSLGLIEPATFPSLGRDMWLPWLEQTDVLLVNGGDTLFLAHHLRESGLAELLPSLDAVWVGVSAGSMVMTPRIGDDFKQWDPPGGGNAALGFVDFAIFPHLQPREGGWGNTMEEAHEWFAKIDVPTAYVMDDETSLVWVDGEVEVVSGTGHWKQFPAA